MQIGFIGAGRNAQTMARHLLAAGYRVILSNSRGKHTLSSTVSALGPGASAGSIEDVTQADIVILAVNWANVKAALDGIQWTGQILIDATNAHVDAKPDVSPEGIARSRAALGDKTSSELVASWAPGSRLVKAISSMPMAWIEDVSSGPRKVLFVAGDDTEAKTAVVQVLERAGFAGIDLGPLSTGRLFDVGGPLSGLDLNFVKRLR